MIFIRIALFLQGTAQLEAITLNKVNYVRVKISKATEAQLKSHDKNT